MHIKIYADLYIKSQDFHYIIEHSKIHDNEVPKCSIGSNPLRLPLVRGREARSSPVKGRLGGV
jgi:hypothetical protein